MLEECEIMAKYMVWCYDDGKMPKEKKAELREFAKFIIDEFIQDKIFDMYKECKNEIESAFGLCCDDDECEDLWELEDCEYRANVLEPQVSELNRR